jgi:hypothetical protein
MGATLISRPSRHENAGCKPSCKGCPDIGIRLTFSKIAIFDTRSLSRVMASPRPTYSSFVVLFAGRSLSPDERPTRLSSAATQIPQGSWRSLQLFSKSHALSSSARIASFFNFLMEPFLSGNPFEKSHASLLNQTRPEVQSTARQLANLKLHKPAFMVRG